MNFTATTVAFAAAISFTTAVSANPNWDPSLDESFLLNDGNVFNLGFQQTIDFTVAVSAGSPVIGFSFSGIASGISPFGAELLAEWTQLTVEAPDGQTFIVGSLTSPFANDAPWDFSTASAQNGLYRHGLGGGQWFGDGQPQFAFGSGASADGIWTFSFFQTLGSGIGWEDVTITLHRAIPAPSALALLVAFGLAGHTRRRGA